MRWLDKFGVTYDFKKKLYETKQKVTVTKFLWFPKRIKNKWRWLELATFKRGAIKAGIGYDWNEEEWINK